MFSGDTAKWWTHFFGTIWVKIIEVNSLSVVENKLKYKFFFVIARFLFVWQAT